MSSHTNRYMASLMEGLNNAATYNSMTQDQRLYVDKILVEANEKIETLYDEMNFQAKESARLRAELEAARVDAERSPWIKFGVDGSVPSTGRYIVAHRGYAVVAHYLNPEDGCWHEHSKLGWIGNVDFGPTHYMPLPPIEKAAIDAARGKDNG